MHGAMKDEEILPKLEEILGQLGVELRYEKGDFEGGICRVGEKQLLLVNKRLMLSQKVNLLARELASLDLSPPGILFLALTKHGVVILKLKLFQNGKKSLRKKKMLR
jgi:hypothetical protein